MMIIVLLRVFDVNCLEWKDKTVIFIMGDNVNLKK